MFKMLKDKKARPIFISIMIVVLALLTTFIIIGVKSCDSEEYVTISFETGEGSNITPVKVAKGKTVDELPTPSIAGYTFSEWYKDDELTVAFDYNEAIEEDLTLYAEYALSNKDLLVNENTEFFEEDCEKDQKITVIGPKGLSKMQFFSLVNIEAVTGELPEFDVEINNDEYTIIPLKVAGAKDNGYEEGKLYRIILPNEFHFKDYKSSINQYTFRIKKDEVMDVEINDDIKYVLSSEVKVIEGSEEDTYQVYVSKEVCLKYDFKTNDIISISDEYKYDSNKKITLDTDNSLVLRVDEVVKFGVDYIIQASQASISEIFPVLDINFVEGVDPQDIISTLDEEAIAEQLKYSEGVSQISQLLALSIASSSSVKKALSTGPDFTDNSYIFEDTAKELKMKFKDVEIQVKIGTGHNPNFDAAYTDEFCVITFKLIYDADIKKRVKINAEFEITQYIAITMQGDSDYSLSLKNPWLRFEYAFNVYSQTDIDLTVLICSLDDDERKYKDISKEINDLLSKDDTSNDDLLSQFCEMIDNDSGEIELLTVPIIKTSYPVIPIIHVLDVNTNLNFVVKVNFAAGISIDASVLEAVQIGAKGDTRTGKIESIRNDLPGGDQYSLEFCACGYMGIKFGFEASLTISFCGASKFGEVGIAVFVGPYIDMYGYVKMSFSRVGYAPSLPKTVKSEVYGGYYIEIGINVQVELIARSSFFHAKVGTDLLNENIPLVNFGCKEILYDVKDREEATILLNDSTQNDVYTIDYKNIVYGVGYYLDITNGKIKEKDISWDDFHLTFDNKCFSYDYDNSKIVYNRALNKDVYTDECTLTYYYTGSYLMFNTKSKNKLTRCLAGTIKLIWTDTSVVPEENAGKTYNAKIEFVVDGEVVEEREQPVRAGTKIGYVYNPYTTHAYASGAWDKDTVTTVVTDDTTFRYITKANQFYVAFVWYEPETLLWKLEVRAVKVGEMPVAPEITTSDKVHFEYWSATKGKGNGYQNISSVGLSNVPTRDDLYTYGAVASMFTSGYEADEAVRSFESTNYWDVYNAVFTKFKTDIDDADMYFKYMHIYEAKYTYTDCTVSVVVPEDVPGENYQFSVAYGSDYNKLPIYHYNATNKYLIGYSLNEDLSNPLRFDEIPMITTDTTIYLVYGYIKHNVNLYYYDDVKDEYIFYKEVEYTNPDDLDTYLAEVNELLVKEDGVTYEIDYWKYKKGENSYVYVNKNIGISEDLDLYPFYKRTFDVKFDANGGEIFSLDESDTITISSHDENGSYYLYIDKKGIKEDEYYEYEFLGWEDINTGIIYKAWQVGTDLIVSPTTLKAVWGDTTEKIYNVDVITSEGVLLNGEKTDHYSGGYKGYLEFIEKYRNYEIPNIYKEDEGLYLTGELVEVAKNGSDYINDLSYTWTYKKLDVTLTIEVDGGTISSKEIEELVSTGIPSSSSTSYIEYLGCETDANGNVISYKFKYQSGLIVYLDRLSPKKDADSKNTYVFNGFKDLATNTNYNNSESFIIKKDTTLKVVWSNSAIDYTITYYVNGAKISEAVYHYGDKITELARPTDTYKYKWSGWSWYENDTLLNDAPLTMPSKNLVVKGTTEEVKVTYLLDGEVYDAKVVDANSVITLLDKYQKEGYVVSDWKSDDVTVSNNQFTMPEKNVVFSSTSEKAKYKVTYLDLLGNVYEEKEYLFGEIVNLIDLPESTNYYAWTSSDVDIIGKVFNIPSHNVVIQLIESTIQYHVFYVVNNEVVGYSYAIPSEKITLENDARAFGTFEGTFSGWYSPNVSIVDNSFTVSSTDVFLYGYYSSGNIKVNVFLDDFDKASLVLYLDSGTVISGTGLSLEIDKKFIIDISDKNIACFEKDGKEYEYIEITSTMTEVDIKALYSYNVVYNVEYLGIYEEKYDDFEVYYQNEYYRSGSKVYLKELPTITDEYKTVFGVTDWLCIEGIEILTDDDGKKYFIMPNYNVTINSAHYELKDKEREELIAYVYVKSPITNEDILCYEYPIYDDMTYVYFDRIDIDGYNFMYWLDENGNKYTKYDYVSLSNMNDKNQKFYGIYEKITKQVLTFRVDGEIVGYKIYDGNLEGYVKLIDVVAPTGKLVSNWFNEYFSGDYIFISEEVLGEDDIFDAITYDENSSYSLSIKYSDNDIIHELIALNEKYNISDNETITINKKYFEEEYDIKLYLQNIFESDKRSSDISEKYIEVVDDLYIISLPSEEEILTLLNISSEEIESFTIMIELTKKQ